MIPLEEESSDKAGRHDRHVCTVMGTRTFSNKLRMCSLVFPYNTGARPHKQNFLLIKKTLQEVTRRLLKQVLN